MLQFQRPTGTSLRRFFVRMSSTVTIKQMPSKSYLHVPIEDQAFPAGFVLNGLHAGVKKTGALDLSIILSTTSRTSAAACFTRNTFKAAPVIVSEETIDRTHGRARAIVVNSGCANAVTGKQGLEDAWAMATATDALLEPRGQNETLVMSTGVIGQNLPIEKVKEGIKSQSKQSTLGGSFAHWERAAKAFMTTDTFPKLRTRKFTIRDKEYKLAGMDKGAGMIHPDMGPPRKSKELHATLLGCILTDIAITPRSLQEALTYAVDRSFNSISVDGDMSTNDTIIVLANGAADSPEKAEIDKEADQDAYEIFRDELTSFAAELAQLVVRDGEGATKFVTVSVEVSTTF